MDDLLDADEQMLVKKPKPVGWFVAGAVAVIAATVFLAYYMPLSSAHSKLVSEHAALAKKAAELDHWLKADRAELAKTDARRAELQKFVDAGIAVEKKRNGRLETIRATVERELAPFVKSKLLTIDTDFDGLVLEFQERAIFRPRSSATGPSARRTLCKAVSGLTGAKDFTVEASARASSSDSKYWETATDRAEGVAKILDDNCSFPADKLRVVAEHPGSDDKGEPHLVVRLRLEREKRFSPEDAPQVSANVAKKE